LVRGRIDQGDSAAIQSVLCDITTFSGFATARWIEYPARGKIEGSRRVAEDAESRKLVGSAEKLTYFIE
jgi:hypothetical protein